MRLRSSSGKARVNYFKKGIIFNAHQTVGLIYVPW